MKTPSISLASTTIPAAAKFEKNELDLIEDLKLRVAEAMDRLHFPLPTGKAGWLYRLISDEMHCDISKCRDTLNQTETPANESLANAISIMKDVVFKLRVVKIFESIEQGLNNAIDKFIAVLHDIFVESGYLRYIQFGDQCPEDFCAASRQTEIGKQAVYTEKIDGVIDHASQGKDKAEGDLKALLDVLLKWEKEINEKSVAPFACASGNLSSEDQYDDFLYRIVNTAKKYKERGDFKKIANKLLSAENKKTVINVLVETRKLEDLKKIMTNNKYQYDCILNAVMIALKDDPKNYLENTIVSWYLNGALGNSYENGMKNVVLFLETSSENIQNKSDAMCDIFGKVIKIIDELVKELDFEVSYSRNVIFNCVSRIKEDIINRFGQHIGLTPNKAGEKIKAMLDKCEKNSLTDEQWVSLTGTSQKRGWRKTLSRIME